MKRLFVLQANWVSYYSAFTIMSMTSSLSVNRNFWIIGPKRDLAFFILTPVFIIPVMLWLKSRVSAESLGVYILGFGGYGHHLPSFIRAYADRDLFKRFRIRFTVVPVLLILACGVYSF